MVFESVFRLGVLDVSWLALTWVIHGSLRLAPGRDFLLTRPERLRHSVLDARGRFDVKTLVVLNDPACGTERAYNAFAFLRHWANAITIWSGYFRSATLPRAP